MKKILKFVFIPFLIIILILIGFFIYKKYSQKSKISQSNINDTQKKLDLDLSGKILYKKDNAIFLYDLKTKQEKIISSNLDTEHLASQHLIYKNGYVFFMNDKREIIRKDLNTLEEIKTIIDPQKYLNQKDNILYIENLVPSPDGGKITFVVTPTIDMTYYIGDYNKTLLLKDYQTNDLKVLAKTDDYNDFLHLKWFSDNRFLYIDNKLIIDNQTNVKKQLLGLTNKEIYPSASGSNYLWFDEQGVEAKDRGIFQFYRPNLMISSLAKTFPDIAYSKFDANDRTISFLQFPIVARDYKSITKVIPAKGYSDYFIEINSGKNDIFYTDCGGTFKKINPNNPDSYRLIAHLPRRNQILALRTEEDRSYGTKILKSKLVLLNQSNYAESTANIDNGSNKFYEKDLFTFNDANNKYSYEVINNFAISPNEDYLLIPLASAKENFYVEDFIVLSLENGEVFELDKNFGDDFYWLAD